VYCGIQNGSARLRMVHRIATQACKAGSNSDRKRLSYRPASLLWP
jgi:hypothetical protein